MRCDERERIEVIAKDAAVSLRGPAWRKEPDDVYDMKSNTRLQKIDSFMI